MCLFTLSEVNYPFLAPQSRLAVFALFGLVLAFLRFPAHERLRGSRAARAVDVLLAALAAGVCGYIFVQNEPWLARFWVGSTSLGDRAGNEAGLDVAAGVLGLLLVLEATRRSIGWALPALSTAFLAYAWLGPSLPAVLFPHRGYGVERIAAQTFLHSQGVFGTALRVMFVYVFLFVLFGALLQATGATAFIIGFARRAFAGSAGGPAKVAVLSSGLMGSLSGSAVANTATTGTFTIPLMRSSGFRAEIAAGVEAAASSGGALVPPVMGAGAYMMLEIIDPPVTYIEIIRAALIPAILYYVSLLLIVHLYSKRLGLRREQAEDRPAGGGFPLEGVVFLAGFATLLALLIQGFTPFRAVSVSLVAVALVSAVSPRTRVGWGKGLDALARTARDAVPLVTAACCVGIVIGVVTLTGAGTKLATAILGLAQDQLLPALVLIMVASIVLGMGLPSAVCYLLLATLIGSELSRLGVVPLSAHMFIFYFGLMSMVTPPVALAAYAAGSIAGARIMPTALAAFRFALVGFTLPYMFVLRPALLMLDPAGGTARWTAVLGASVLALLGIVPLAAGIAGYLLRPLGPGSRALLFASAALLLIPVAGPLVAGMLGVDDLIGVGLLVGVAVATRR